MSAEEFKRRRDIVEKGLVETNKRENTFLKKRKTNVEQITQLKKVKNIGQLSFMEELDNEGTLY